MIEKASTPAPKKAFLSGLLSPRSKSLSSQSSAKFDDGTPQAKKRKRYMSLGATHELGWSPPMHLYVRQPSSPLSGGKGIERPKIKRISLEEIGVSRSGSNSQARNPRTHN